MNATQLVNEEDFLEIHTGLVHYVCKRYVATANHFGYEYDDLYVIGYIGLMKAYRRFDSSRKGKDGKPVEFSSYAVSLVRGEILRAFRDHGSLLNHPRKARMLYLQIRRNDWLECSVSEIAQLTASSDADVVKALKYGNAAISSLDQPVSVGDGREIAFSDVLPQYDDFTSVNVEEFLELLTPRERIVVLLKMNEKTQQEIAGEIGKTQVTVSRTLSKIAKKATLFFSK